jgi:rare lipoprotein A (peptidoglycan hydrolase)
MNVGHPRRAAAVQPRRSPAPSRGHSTRRPDRVALCAVLLAVSTTVVAAASAQATTGGLSSPGVGVPTSAATPADPAATPADAESFTTAKATWYGPGFYGERTACGNMLRRSTIGVAHRSLPCGTDVTFSYGGRTVVAPVIDRGPFRRGFTWDLTAATARQLGLTSSATVLYAVSA